MDFYWELDVELAPTAEELWSLFCYDRGASGAEQLASDADRVQMRYFFASLEPGAEREQFWQAAFRAAYPQVPGPSRIHLRRKPVRDWQLAWREHFVPTPVGSRLLVCPPWDQGPPEQGAGERLKLIVEPGQGFGTGGHASTVLALEQIEAELTDHGPPAAMLDVGTGSGILAIAAGLLGVPNLWGLEIDSRALPEVRRNFRLNGLTPPPRLVQGKPDCLRGEFPLVAANLTTPILHQFVEELAQLTAPGGRLVLSGMLASEGPGVAAAFGKAGCATIQIAQREGWYACRLLRSA